VGVDLGGKETPKKLDFNDIFKKFQEIGLKVTVHGGEIEDS
jgi:hypothetical protein